MNLNILKTLINGFVDGLSKKVPKTEATYPINEMLEELENYFSRSIDQHPKRFYKDGNFKRLLKNMTRSTIYISEHDSHYRAMLSILFVQISQLMQRELKKGKFKNPTEMISFLSGQNIRYKRSEVALHADT